MSIHVSRRALLVVALALVAIGLACWVAAASGPSDTRPVALPATFMGLGTSEYDDPGTARDLSDAVDGAPLAVRGYGGRGTTTLNVVATRSDMTGEVDLRFLGDDGRLIGGTRCTSDVVLRERNADPDSPGTPLTGKVLCWRTSERLSVSAFVLTRPPAQEDVAAAVDALWVALR